jgi:hypothetical protein
MTNLEIKLKPIRNITLAAIVLSCTSCALINPKEYTVKNDAGQEKTYIEDNSNQKGFANYIFGKTLFTPIKEVEKPIPQNKY